MNAIDAKVVIQPILDGEHIIKHLEKCGRVCYKSEDKITDDSARDFLTMIINLGHETILEHFSFSVLFVCDRGVSHEIVRHRLSSYSQESTRYCNYTKSVCAGNLAFIKPLFWKEDSDEYTIWMESCKQAESCYNTLIAMGAKPQEARSVLPNSLKTEIMMTANVREWRHFFKLRTASAAHPQMRELTIPLLAQLKEIIPIVFDDVGEKI